MIKYDFVDEILKKNNELNCPIFKYNKKILSQQIYSCKFYLLIHISENYKEVQVLQCTHYKKTLKQGRLKTNNLCKGRG